MTTRTAGASDGATWYPIHLISTGAALALSLCPFGATNAVLSPNYHVRSVPSIIQHGVPNGNTVVVVLP